jgi:hypothetical protein
VSRPALSFKSVGLSRRWVAAIDPAREVVAFSPFITNCAAIDALRKKGAACKLYTVVTPEQFTSGGSKVRCLRKLFDAGVEIYHLDKLHAKLLLIDDKPICHNRQPEPHLRWHAESGSDSRVLRG